jgi:hypothetical protein
MNGTSVSGCIARRGTGKGGMCQCLVQTSEVNQTESGNFVKFQTTKLEELGSHSQSLLNTFRLKNNIQNPKPIHMETTKILYPNANKQIPATTNTNAFSRNTKSCQLHFPFHIRYHPNRQQINKR